MENKGFLHLYLQVCIIWETLIHIYLSNVKKKPKDFIYFFLLNWRTDEKSLSIFLGFQEKLIL